MKGMELALFQLHDSHHKPVTYCRTIQTSLIYNLIIRLTEKQSSQASQLQTNVTLAPYICKEQ